MFEFHIRPEAPAQADSAHLDVLGIDPRAERLRAIVAMLTGPLSCFTTDRDRSVIAWCAARLRAGAPLGRGDEELLAAYRRALGAQIAALQRCGQ